VVLGALLLRPALLGFALWPILVQGPDADAMLTGFSILFLGLLIRILMEQVLVLFQPSGDSVWAVKRAGRGKGLRQQLQTRSTDARPLGSCTLSSP